MIEVPASRSRNAKTSNDILQERNELAARVKIFEAVLNAIGLEARHALNHPQISLTTLCRIESLVTQADAKHEAAPVSGLRPRLAHAT